MIASAIGERTEFIVHENKTAEGRSDMLGLRPDMQNANQREQPARGVLVDDGFFSELFF
jgi:hypothetical protein